MLPPFVTAANPPDRRPAAEASLLPPLRLAGGRTPPPPAAEVDQPLEMLDQQVAEIPWLVTSPPEEGQIDESSPTGTSADEAGYFDSTFRDIDLENEWETDQLASLEEEVDDAPEITPPPAAAGEPHPAVFTGDDTPPDRDDPPAEAFESDAEMFVKLLDELEASARAESARMDDQPSVEWNPAPKALEARPGSETAAAPDARRVEEIASRLERIARSLRERGPSGPLADEGADPLGAMVAGYLLGLSERTPEAEVRDRLDGA